MKIIVTVKLVPDTNAEKRIDPDTKRLLRAGVETVLNPFDEYALEAALRLKERRGGDAVVTICTMAAQSEKPALRKALAMGADDAVMVSDAALEGSDVGTTAYVLAAALEKIGFDVIVCGAQSTDAATGDLPGILAEYLGIPGLTSVRAFELATAQGEPTIVRAERETDYGFQAISAALPALVSVTKTSEEPRFPSLKGIMGAKNKTIATLSLADLGLDRPVGVAAAKTEVLALAPPPARGKGRIVTVGNGEDGARVIVDFLKEKKLL